MALLRVNPTRMELTRLKRRLKAARRGHRLLKDKRDELMKQFLERVRQCRQLHLEVQAQLAAVHESVRLAQALSGPDRVAQALMLPRQDLTLAVRQHTVLSVAIPLYSLQPAPSPATPPWPFGPLMTAADLDEAVERMQRLLPELLRLAELEKGTQLIAAEIERTRRRVNALEYVVLPQLSETIRSITMKLDENERGNLTRLMKVKDMLLAQARQAQGEE